MHDTNNFLASIEPSLLQKFTSLIIIQDNHVLLEEYFNNFQPHELHEAQSTTKSIISVLLGIAFDKDFLKDPSARIAPFFQELKNIQWNNHKQDISIEDLLTMRAGLAWNESELSYQSMLNEANLFFRSKDWLSYYLTKPMKSVPGDFFSYSSANPVLLSNIIHKASEIPIKIFIENNLLKPLGITEYYYDTSVATQEVIGDLYLKPSDLIKFGILLLNKGNWKGKQIVTSQWVEQSTKLHLKLNTDEGYGYCWWLKTFQVNGISIPCIYAWGYGGQHIFVFETLNLVIGTTAKLYNVTLAKEPFEVIKAVLKKIISNT